MIIYKGLVKNMDKAIVVKNVSKKYRLFTGSKERILDLIFPNRIGEEFFALKDVDFEAEKGDIIGFVGTNGSGKSTLSNIIAGIVPQTSGKIEINGQAALIAVASGLKGDLSGRENIELKLLMLGFNKEEISELEPHIIEFAELEKFIDQPVKSYSSGMKSRLGFAISVNVDPDILIIDEALSVGDKAFATKSLNKMLEFKENGKTMIFVSHSLGQMKKFCEKILWLEYGRVKAYGDVGDVLPRYEAFLEKWEKLPKEEREAYRENVIADGPTEDVEELLHKVETDETYEEEYTSMLGHLRGAKSYIYSSPMKENKEPSDEFKNSVYYIKKQAVYQGNKYYLLSEEPSAEKGTIGWMKSNDLSLHVHLSIEEISKTLSITGNGSAFSRPWGGKKNLVYEDLNEFKDQPFQVMKLEMVGKNVWYNGILNDKEVWLHSSQVLVEEEAS
ncbi:teichoic acids export ABC transporter ATP-binding subunit TagH [Oceanobacillus sp. CAU 1775]